MSDDKLEFGVGLDIGTMNIIASKQHVSGAITRKRVRDCFIDLEPESTKMLRLRKIEFVQREKDVLLLGDAALKVANVFGKEPRRPLKQGVISAAEIDSLEVLGLMVKSVLGEPSKPGETCCFSVPAAPMDNTAQDVIYHRGVFEQIIRECGYTPVASNEAMAIIFSEAADDDFSGIAISFGSGMSNVALSINTIEALTFSVERGGDWIDQGSSKSIGTTAAKMCAIKEKGTFNLMKPESREEQALAFYYRELIRYTLTQLSKKFKTVQNTISLDEPVPLIISGGTSLANGFVEFFTELFNEQKDSFPIQIKEIRHASDALNAVADGLLVQAMQLEI